jgi:hypothetical protein
LTIISIEMAIKELSHRGRDFVLSIADKTKGQDVAGAAF